MIRADNLIIKLKMENQNQTPAPVRAFVLTSGFASTQIISALVKTNVIETLGIEPGSTEELAATCKLNSNVLSRTLRYAALIGLVNFADNKYSLTDVGRCFLKGVPGGLWGSAHFITAPPWSYSWDNFTHCLQTGQPAFDHVWKQPFFEFLDKNEVYGKQFNNYQTALTTLVAPVVPEAYDFSIFKTICDVGGGQGILLKAILEKNPQSRGILFDMGNAMIQHILGEIAERVDFIAGSFFDNIPSADCLILKTVIHDWNDENGQKILINCRKALNPDGKIIIVEQIVDEPYTLASLFYDLHMQVMLGGRERTEAEFRALLLSAGLKLTRIIPTRSPMRIIEVGI
jgi:SAM-dependent methyltransferase